MTDETDEHVTLRGTITLSQPGTTPLTVEVLEFGAQGSFRAPTALHLRLEGAMGELAKLRERIPALDPLFPLAFDPTRAGIVELRASPALLARLREIELPEGAPMDLDALFSCEPWSQAAFDIARYEAHAVGVRAEGGED